MYTFLQSKKHANKVRRYMYIHKDDDNPLIKRLKASTNEEVSEKKWNALDHTSCSVADIKM